MKNRIQITTYILSLFVIIVSSFSMEISIIEHLTVQRTDGSNYFDIYYEISGIESAVEISVLAICEKNDTIIIKSVIEPSDIGIVSTDGIKHIVWETRKDLGNSEISGYYDFVINAYLEKETVPYEHNCIYITNSRSDDIIRIDNIYGENYTILNSGIFGGLNSATDISTDCDGRIYIVDSYNRRIVKLDNMYGFGYVSLGKSRECKDRFGILCGIAFDDENRIYVTDYENSRVIRVDNMNGDGWTVLGEFGSNDFQFNKPHGIAIDSQNRVYIADTHNHRVVRVDDILGNGWTSIGTHGNGLYQFIKPTGIQVDEMNRIYISDRGNYRVVRLEDFDGSGWETCYPGTKALYNLDVDNESNIYITDILHNRIIMIKDMDPNSVIYFSTKLNRPYGIHINK